MDLTLSPDQRMIRDEAARFLAERAGSDDLRALIESGERWNPGLWRSIATELGWCAMAIPESDGGLGLGATEVVVLMELAGARLAPVPLWSTLCLATPLLLELADGAGRSRLLARIAQGEIAVTVALGDPGAADGGAPAIRARTTDDGYVLDGTLQRVVDAEAADVVLVPATLDDGGTGLFALERGIGAELTPLEMLDTTRPIARLLLRDVALPGAARLDQGGVSAGAMARALDFAALGLAAEQIGAARAAMDLTLAYISERVQFGRTIASFQAIKHRCAELEVAFAEARALAYGIAAGLVDSADEERNQDIAALRVLADDLAKRAAREAIQMHGGVAITWEYDPHFYFKRAQASSVLLGARDAHLDRIAAGLLGERGQA
jgi:alkylation response protein AidB-like acyl-CoA dehydrogenase